MKKEILEALSFHREQLAALGVKKIGVFGLFAKDQGTRNSEVDLLVELQPGKDAFNDFMALVASLEKILGHVVNLLPMQPRCPYIDPEILASAEYILIADGD